MGYVFLMFIIIVGSLLFVLFKIVNFVSNLFKGSDSEVENVYIDETPEQEVFEADEFTSSNIKSYCTYCGTALSPNGTYCPACGSKN